MTPVPEEDTTQLVEALHDKLHALRMLPQWRETSTSPVTPARPPRLTEADGLLDDQLVVWIQDGQPV
jgi:hypothetical protein